MIGKVSFTIILAHVTGLTRYEAVPNCFELVRAANQRSAPVGPYLCATADAGTLVWGVCCYSVTTPIPVYAVNAARRTVCNEYATHTGAISAQ